MREPSPRGASSRAAWCCSSTSLAVEADPEGHASLLSQERAIATCRYCVSTLSSASRRLRSEAGAFNAPMQPSHTCSYPRAARIDYIRTAPTHQLRKQCPTSPHPTPIASQPAPVIREAARTACAPRLAPARPLLFSASARSHQKQRGALRSGMAYHHGRVAVVEAEYERRMQTSTTGSSARWRGVRAWSQGLESGLGVRGR